MTPTPDYQESLRFLKLLRPDGPWSLIAFPKAVAATFHPGEEAALLQWLVSLGETQNLHYSINVADTVDKKATKANITRIDYVHVDIDVRGGEDLSAEKARILNLDFCKAGLPQPTFIVFSGHGANVLFKLKEPIPVNGDPNTITEVEQRNQYLAVTYDGDLACKNVDRVFRLPGTINRKPQRELVLAYIHKEASGNEYALLDFPKTEMPAKQQPAQAKQEVSLPAELPSIDSLDDFPQLKDWVKVLIANGRPGLREVFPDRKEYPSDSEAVIAVLCEGMRAGLSDETLAAIIHPDNGWAISAHIKRQKKGHWGKYIERQLARAHEFVSSEKPKIQLPEGDRQYIDFAADVAPLLRQTGRIFIRHGCICSLQPDNTFESLGPETLREELERVARFFIRKPKKDGSSTTDVLQNLFPNVPKAILKYKTLINQLPVVRIVSHCPLFYQDRVITGYDEQAGIFATGREPEPVSFADAPRLLLALLCDYDFVSQADRARAIAAILTPALGRGGLLGGRMPLTVIEADDSQAGKGYFCKIVGALYSTATASIARQDGGVGSLDEAVGDKIIKGKEFIQIDNVRGRIQSQFFESILTESSVNIRVPYQPNVSVDPRAICFLLTSNNAEFTPDLANRSNIIRIRKHKDDHQWAAWPEGDLLSHVQANHPLYLGAIYTILQEWLRRGRPKGAHGGHDFREWTQVIRAIVVDLMGLEDPIKDMREIQRRTSSKNEGLVREIAHAVKNTWRMNVWLTTTDLLDICLDKDIPFGDLSDADTDNDGVRQKALQCIGRKLSAFFGDKGTAGSQVTKSLEGLYVTRCTSETTNNHGKLDKKYMVTETPELPEDEAF